MQSLLAGSWGWLIVTLGCAVACGDDGGGGGLGGAGEGGAAEGGAAEGGAGEGGAGEGGEGGEGGGSEQTACQAICGHFDGLELEVMCGYDGSGCIPECEAGFAGLAAGCEDEAIAYNDCLMAQPADAYNCTNGIFTLTSGACDEQLDALVSCG